MKFIPFAAAAMLLTTAAFGQDAAAPAPGSSAPEMAPAPGAAGDAGATPAPGGAASGGAAPDNGNAGVSGSASPAGAPADQAPGGQVIGGQGVGGASAANTNASVAPGTYPTCSRTVKDGCVQAAGRTRRR